MGVNPGSDTAKRDAYFELMADMAGNTLMSTQGQPDACGFDWSTLRGGHPVQDWPQGASARVQFTVLGHGSKAPMDWLDVPWHFASAVSERVKCALENGHIHGVQFLPIAAIHDLSGLSLGTYYVLNITAVKKALDYERTRWIGERCVESNPEAAFLIFEPALKLERTDGADVFCLDIGGKIRGVYVSRRFKECLEQAGATAGVGFVPVEAY